MVWRESRSLPPTESIVFCRPTSERRLLRARLSGQLTGAVDDETQRAATRSAGHVARPPALDYPTKKLVLPFMARTPFCLPQSRGVRGNWPAPTIPHFPFRVAVGHGGGEACTDKERFETYALYIKTTACQ